MSKPVGGRKTLVGILALLFLISVPFSANAAYDRFLSLGSQGSDVSALQTFLTTKGFYTFPTITGYFGIITKDALAKFQASVGLEPVGEVGPKTLGLLNGSAGITNPVLSLGSRGPEVSALQQFLKDLGFFTYPDITDFFGPITQAALEAFQKAKGLPITGSVNQETKSTITDIQNPSSTTDDEDEGTEDTTPLHVAPTHSHSHSEDTTTASGDTTGPAISAVASGSLTSATASITWTTDEAADSQVEYGLTTSYGLASSLDATLTTSHTVSLSGLSAATTYHYRVLSSDASGNDSASADQTFTTSAAPDTTPPARSAGSPTGTLALNTTSTTISLTTNENATCKYSTSSGAAYSSMTVFGTTGTTSHSSNITGLTNGGSYIYYVKCADSLNNINVTDYTISFTVAADTTSPTVAITAPINSARVSGNAVAITATASDDVSVSGVQFKLDTTTNIGVEDTTSAYGVTWDSTAVADGSHTLIAVARDGSGNYATSSVITVIIDNTAPVLSSGSPSGTLAYGTTNTTLSLTTNENATCKYSTSPGTAYGSMTSFTTTGTTSHSSTISGLTNATSYTYYVKCQDARSNTNASDFAISFSVAADTTAPSVSLSAPSNGSTVSGASVALSATASDDVSVSGVQFKLDTSTNIGSEITSAPYTMTWNSILVADGVHTISAVARDSSGNYATSTAASITVDNTAPLISSIASSTATTTASITWTTNEASDSRVDYGTTTGYGSASTSAATSTSHTIALSGLTPNTTYHFRIQSTDGQGNIAISSDKTLTTAAYFNVASLPNWSAAVRAMQAGTSDVKIAALGDSTTMGAGSNATQNLWRPNSFPVKLATLLTNAGYRAQMDNAFGSGQQNATTIFAQDARTGVTTGAASTLVSGNYALGGRVAVISSGTGSYIFSPGNIFDTIEIRYGKSSGFGGTVTVNIDGGASLGTISEVASSDSYNVATFTVARGVHTVNIVRSSGVSVIFSVETWDSTNKSIHIKNMGAGSATSGDLANAAFPWNPRAALPAHNASLTLINAGINDWLQGVSVSTFETNYRALIATATSTGDVVLETPFPSNIAGASQANQQAIVDKIKAIGTELNLPVVDVFGHFGTWAAANTAGKTYDNNHPNSAGYDDIAALIYAAITPH